MYGIGVTSGCGGIGGEGREKKGKKTAFFASLSQIMASILKAIVGIS